MTARCIYTRTARIYWQRGGYLLLLGAAVFVPLGLIDALADRAPELHVSDPGQLGDLSTIALLLGFAAQAFTSLIGEVFYSGAVALSLAAGERQPPPSLRTVARRLAYGRLIAVDLVFGAIVAAGLIAFIVPGVILFTWFALAGPVVELEGAGIWAALKRSRRLVRGRFWKVFAVLVPITLASELLSTGSLQVIHLVIHEPLLGDWVGEAVTNILLSPFYAVAAVLLTLELSHRSG